MMSLALCGSVAAQTLEKIRLGISDLSFTFRGMGQGVKSLLLTFLLHRQ
jgi:hypothetical protein